MVTRDFDLRSTTADDTDTIVALDKFNQRLQRGQPLPVDGFEALGFGFHREEFGDDHSLFLSWGKVGRNARRSLRSRAGLR